MKLFFLLVALSCLVHSVSGYGSGISSTVFSLANYQAENGGFTTQVMEGVPGSLDDTANALFLTSLFGVKEKIHAEAANNFLASLQNSDGGFSNLPGQNSDLESVWNAIWSYRLLGSDHHDTSKLLSFVNSLYDSNAKLFRNTASSSPDYRATARALQLFQLLGLEDKDVATKKAEISAKLESAVKDNDKGHSFFSSITSDNYFGVLVASLVGYEFEDEDDWIAYFKDRQVPTGPKMGGFYSDEYATEVDVSDAEFAVHAIFLLNKKSTVTRSQINLSALSGYLNAQPPALATAAHAYAALARTSAFQDVFKIVPSYVVRDNRFKVVGNRIIQGTLFRPNLFFRTSYGQPHGAATASVVVKHADKSETQTFNYNPQTHTYESQDYFDSTGLFGEVVLTFSLKWSVPGFEDLTFTQADRKSIGFDISINAVAVGADDRFDPGETIVIPTAFTFGVQLGTVSVPRPQLVSGDFDVVLTAFDSSNVVVHTATFNARGNNEEIAFQYELSSANLPAGRLTFRFQIKGEKGVHTTEEVWYKLRLAMVATDIDFDQDQVFNFNQNVKVTMQPATLYDGSVETYEAGSRRIFLDIRSPQGVLLSSFPGQYQNGKYVFEYALAPRLDFAGTHAVTFRYTDAAGQDFQLQNYNSEENALYEEAITYNVDVSLEASDLTEAPTGGSLSYGQTIAFSFVVKDSWTESAVQRGGGDSTVFLALRHKDANGNTFYSSKVRPTPERDPATGTTKFNVDWEVDPNAFKGPAQLVLFGTDADGKEIPIKYEGENWAVDVSVDGALHIENKAYSREFDDQDSAFFVYFELTSQGNKLAGADLTARVTFKNSVVAILPVAASPDGSYQVSWSLPTDRAVSGDYVVDILRQVDVDRAGSVNTASPFFSVTINHQGRATSPLPFKTEFLVLLVLGVTLFSVSAQKSELEKKL